MLLCVCMCVCARACMAKTRRVDGLVFFLFCFFPIFSKSVYNPLFSPAVPRHWQFILFYVSLRFVPVVLDLICISVCFTETGKKKCGCDLFFVHSGRTANVFLADTCQTYTRGW